MRHGSPILLTLTVMSFVIILKRAKPTQARLIAEVFNISSNNVAVIFIDEAEGELTLTNEQDL
ncbi:hypothetical protein AX14_005926 [Amanita brunnescens Koide BX004]|nr:hypothetical protein AX14_005926 [Amanita brunnescens Koide BX004]